MALRSCPSLNAAYTVTTLACNEIFAVSQEIQAYDGRIYLRLADGRGWAVDDSAIAPQSPSVVRGMWAPVNNVASPLGLSIPLPQTRWEPICEPACEADVHKKRRRRKRGGVKRNKSKRLAAAAEAAAAALKGLNED